MPREPQPEIQTIQGPNGLVAAAVRLTRTASGKPKKVRRPAPWYRRAWGFFDTIPEYHYACTWVGNLLSRAELVIWEDGKLTTNQVALDALASFFGGPDGQREMLRQTGTHLTVPGDVYIVGEDQGDAPDKWSVVSATRISNVGWTATTPGTWKVGDRELDDPIVIRLWVPHPDKQEDADSPSRAVLPVLAELENLSKMVASQILSRLSGAGILKVPSEMSFGSVRSGVPVEGEEAARAQGIDAFLVEFMETIMLGIQDPEDPAARTPIILAGPGEYLQYVEHLTIWTELQETAKSMRDECVRRIALGMNMPPEVLTGAGELNHWNAWQVEEASIKAHTEPLLQVITSGLTDSWLRPFLMDSGMSEEEARAFSVHADTTKIRLRPNRSKEAIELFDRALLSGEATARENGFDTADFMNAEERVEFFKRKVAGGSTTPELVAWALNLLGIPMPPQDLVQVRETPTEERPTPSLQEHPERRIPNVQDADIAAANVVVFRALEKAGAKLRTKYATALVAGADAVANERLYRYAHVSEDMVDDLLASAWDCMEPLGITIAPVTLDGYVRRLFQTNFEHRPEALRAYVLERT